MVIEIAWIPSHSGITGNEKVDTLAKMAAQSNDHSNLIFQPADFFSVAIRNVQMEWEQSWVSSPKGNHYKAVNGLNIPSKPWFYKKNYSKPSVSTLCRLRIGHCVVASHLHRIGVFQSPMCECGEEPETINHVFFNCASFNNHLFLTNLNKLKIPFPNSIQSLLALRRDDVNSIILKAAAGNNKKF
jgi:hypothetical protein